MVTTVAASYLKFQQMSFSSQSALNLDSAYYTSELQSKIVIHPSTYLLLAITYNYYTIKIKSCAIAWSELIIF